MSKALIKLAFVLLAAALVASEHVIEMAEQTAYESDEDFASMGVQPLPLTFLKGGFIQAQCADIGGARRTGSKSKDAALLTDWTGMAKAYDSKTHFGKCDGTVGVDFKDKAKWTLDFCKAPVNGGEWGDMDPSDEKVTAGKNLKPVLGNASKINKLCGSKKEGANNCVANGFLRLWPPMGKWTACRNYQFLGCALRQMLPNQAKDGIIQVQGRFPGQGGELSLFRYLDKTDQDQALAGKDPKAGATPQVTAWEMCFLDKVCINGKSLFENGEKTLMFKCELKPEFK